MWNGSIKYILKITIKFILEAAYLKVGAVS